MEWAAQFHRREEPKMDDDVREFGTALGRAALARSWATVHGMLAPWLRSAQSVELGGNGFTKATQLREPISFAGGKVRPVSPEVTDANVRYWMCMKLPCSEEQMEELDFDIFCEAWAAVVETSEGLRVGYWSQGAY